MTAPSLFINPAGPLEFVQTSQGEKAGLGLGCCEVPTCTSRAVGVWQDKVKNGFWLCETHRLELGAPDMPEGIAYAPTGNLRDGYTRKNGKVVRIERNQ